MRPVRLDHVSVTCADLDRSLGFYRDVLGLPLLDRGEDGGPEMERLTGLPGARFLWAELDLGGGQILELLRYLEPAGRPLAQRTSDPGSGHLALLVDDVAAFHARLAAAGVATRSDEPVLVTGFGGWVGVKVLYALDPDGVTVELVERPESR